MISKAINVSCGILAFAETTDIIFGEIKPIIYMLNSFAFWLVNGIGKNWFAVNRG